MRINHVEANHRKKLFELTADDRTWTYPFARAEPRPEPGDRVVSVEVDEEIGGEGFTYVLASGAEGTIHVEQVLEYHRDPRWMQELREYLEVSAMTDLSAGDVAETQMELIGEQRFEPEAKTPEKSPDLSAPGAGPPRIPPNHSRSTRRQP